MSSLLPRIAGAALSLGLLLALILPAGTAQAAQPAPPPDDSTPARTVPFDVTADWDVDNRLAQPEDRYALAGGCYAIQVPDGGFVARDGDDLVIVGDRTAAAPFHFQATRLGEYLIATNEGADERYDAASWDIRGYVSAQSLVPELALRGSGIPVLGEGLLPAAPLPTMPTTGLVTVAAEPSDLGNWRVEAAGTDREARVRGTARRGAQDPSGPRPPGANPQSYTVSLPASGKALAVTADELRVVDAAAGDAFAFHHVADGAGCARWPEIDTNTSGPPIPSGNGPAGEAEGFFEAHVHGMAFEFLGGELRCGRPWHPYGVEYALGDCFEDGNFYNQVLEVGLAGRGPADIATYDPIGWPTFGYWPAQDTLTHEQFYWRWLERAHHGGLRLLTNLLVDNTALCQAFPIKKNSCNEMDGVRLQAQRLFEFQDYIDAQSGGPGEGWLRIVTSPAQAREVINAGRLAVVLGIEISVLFDCGEVLDVPQCTVEEIDERLDEVFDMGVRQLQIINKFDNALSGVTGDGGSTGVVVNTGNRHVTGHWWDMQTCVDDDAGHGHELEGTQHDKTQINPRDDVPGGDREEIDVLAGTVLETFGLTRGFVAPLYPEGPHCNTRGLTELGAHVVEAMIARGIIFDPDHMSALAQRQALDLIEHELIPAEAAAAAIEGRPALQPAVISSHSWANDVIYQRIYGLDGVVAPRTARADGFANSWRQHKAWAEQQAPEGAPFGIGYGADTNGLGGQPGPRANRDEPFDYDGGFAAPIGDVTIFQHTSGLRTYDVGVDGVAHYGLFADWFRDVELAAEQQVPGQGLQIRADMLAGSETYLRIWERAVYGGSDCVNDQSSLQVEDLHALLGANVEGFLTAAGQPISRNGAAYVYCVESADGDREVVEVHFDDDGSAASVDPGSVQAWLDADRAGAILDHSHGPEGLPLEGGHGDGPGHLVLLLGAGVFLLRLHPARRVPASHLAIVAPLLVVLAFTLP